jgi:phosphatidylglycerophosphate synthase
MLARVPRPSRILVAELAVGTLGSAALLGGLALGVGLGPVGLVAGATAAAALVAVLLGSGVDRLGPAGRVTLARGVLTVGATALVADPVSVPGLVVCAGVALALDGVDGAVARRRKVASTFGARFDMELDAVLVLVLSVHVAGLLGSWVLLIGLARYLFVAAGAVLPWLRGELVPLFSGKVVAAIQGVVLVVVSSQLLPGVVARVLVAAALAALAWSFGRDVVRLWRAADEHPVRVRPAVAAVVTVTAATLVLVALLTPGDFALLTPLTWLRVPLEVIVGLAVAAVLPARVRRWAAWIGGIVLGLLLVLTLFDIGFSVSLARPFDPVRDAVLLGNAYDFVAGTSGPAVGVLVAVLAAVLAVVLVVATGGAVARLARIAGARRSASVRLAAVLAVAWAVAWAGTAQLVPNMPLASRDTSIRTVERAEAVGTGVRDQAAFASEASVDAYRDVPGEQLLTALRGRDVVVAVVESYGMSVLEDPAMSGPVRAVLADGERSLGALGYEARSGVLTSPVAGGGSWLAHATLLSGLWIDGEQRHRSLVASDRLTLPRAFQEAGWRSVAVAPGTTQAWPEASFFGYDQAYGAADLGYRGPRYSWSTMPDQYALAAFDRLEYGRADRPPLMAEIALTSSHGPWFPLPRTVPWEAVGDGSVFAPADGPQRTFESIFTTPAEQVREEFRRSIEYSLETVVAWIGHVTPRDPERAPVLVVLGDHEPYPMITGPDAGRDVPISIVSRDPAVLDRIASWGWSDGLAPDPDAPVWRMDAFRDRFLEAYGSRP